MVDRNYENRQVRRRARRRRLQESLQGLAHPRGSNLALDRGGVAVVGVLSPSSANVPAQA